MNPGAPLQPEEPPLRYRIILGDTCPVCRALSRLTFPAERPPTLPISECRDPGGCHCKLPVFAPAASTTSTSSAQPPPVEAPAPAGASAFESAAPEDVTHSQPAEPPAATSVLLRDWARPAPITQNRRRILAELQELYQQGRIQGLRIVTAPDCCAACKEVAASLYDPAIAPPLPVVGCAHGWDCHCQYAEEPLPLDERGLAAMRRLSDLEHERQLRRAGVSLGGPHGLHAAAAIVGLGVIASAIWLAVTGGWLQPWLIIAPMLLAAASLLVSGMAMRRLHPLPSPPWSYTLSGLGIALAAMAPLWEHQLPLGFTLEWLGAAVTAPSLVVDALRTLSHAQLALTAEGCMLLLIGLFDGQLAGRPRRPAESGPRRAALQVMTIPKTAQKDEHF